MKSLTYLVFLSALCGAGYGVPELVEYDPEILQAPVVGKVTQTTATFEQPLCVFDNIETSCSFCEVWLVVDNVTTQSAFDRNNSHVNPKDFMSGAFSKNGFYLTVRTARNQYQCRSGISNITMLYTIRVGNESPCVTDNCNKPLPTGSTFRVRYILRHPFRTSDNVVAVTRWSSNVKLLDAVDPNNLDALTSRSGGMVVLTTILSILLFLLLLLFIALLAMFCCRRSGSSNFSEPITTFGSLRRYNTHSLQNKGNIITTKGNF
ncbi:uroplakin-3b [Hypanus sabinus]|uniref:uroplakin-3b n=1 Tax=Hypanus sabinus TaxID=79690 RepID=UPI0028C4E965|nr:uroplakin-3b [Hypanus sabinus]